MPQISCQPIDISKKSQQICLRRSLKIQDLAKGLRISAAKQAIKLARNRSLCIYCSAINTQHSGHRGLALHIINCFEDAKALEGCEVGVSDWILVDQERINRFAEATNDFQWIHVDVERAARELPDGKTIAHGYLTLGLLPVLTGNFVRMENLARTINYGCNKVRFYKTVPVDSRVRARAVLKQARQRAGALHLLSEIKVEIEGERKFACVAETLGLYYFEQQIAIAS